MGYDALGRRTSVTNSGNAFDEPAFNIYGYNSRNELTSSNRYLGTSILDTASPVDEEARGYDYDPIGNRIAAQQDYDISTSAPITSTYVTNSLNQYESVMAGGSTISLDYDDDGNLIHKDGVEYVFNCENRLVEVSPLAPVIGDTKVAFAYDYMGRRYLKQSYVYSAGEWSLVSTSTSLWEGWNRIQEKVVLASDGSEDITSYVWGLDLSQSLQGAGGVGGLIAVVDDDSDVDFYLYDANGNVGQLISATDGTLHATYEYDPFGRLINAQGSKANQNPYRFSTKPMDQQTGLYYYGYRYLDVDLGRWVSRDPIGERGGWNLYGFVGNSVIIGIDFIGLSKAQEVLKILKLTGKAGARKIVIVEKKQFTKHGGLTEFWAHRAKDRKFFFVGEPDMSDVELVAGKYPRNAQYANTHLYFDDKDLQWVNEMDGVPVTKKGIVDFRGFVELGKNDFELKVPWKHKEYTGRPGDRKKAIKMLEDMEIVPDGWDWNDYDMHHQGDYVYVINKKLHATVGHTGEIARKRWEGLLKAGCIEAILMKLGWFGTAYEAGEVVMQKGVVEPAQELGNKLNEVNENYKAEIERLRLPPSSRQKMGWFKVFRIS